MIEIERWPDLRDPMLVVSVAGWVDAGFAGAGAVAVLTDRMGSAATFARVPLDEIADLQQARPSVRLVDGVTREIDWPSLDLVAGTAGRDVVVLHGPEPALRWRALVREVVELAARLGVQRAFALSGMPAPVSHRHPVRVLATATARSLAQEVGPLRDDYAGPTGLQTALQVALGEAGIPTVGLWAAVPHYVAANPSPPAIRALLARLRELAPGLDVDLAALDARSDEYAAQVDAGLEERPDVAEMVRTFEEQRAEELPDADELVSEIERFLRSGPDQ